MRWTFRFCPVNSQAWRRAAQNRVGGWRRSLFKVVGFGMRQIRTILKWALPSAKAIGKLLATSAEVFCRHSFGQRYAGAMIGSFLLCLLYYVVIESVVPGWAPLLGAYSTFPALAWEEPCSANRDGVSTTQRRREEEPK